MESQGLVRFFWPVLGAPGADDSLRAKVSELFFFKWNKNTRFLMI